MLHRQTNISLHVNGSFRRRDFLRFLPATAAACLPWTDRLAAGADELRKRNMACILLWMQGGPSQFETFSPKPGHRNGGETKAISTATPGVEISEHLPHTAKAIQDVCVLRSLTGKEGSHPRASYLLHTGYLPTAAVKYPSLGANAAHHLGDLQNDLPSFVKIGRGRSGGGAGLLGVDYDPLVLASPRTKPANTDILTSDSRYRRRLGLLSKMEDHYAREGGRDRVEDHRKLYRKTAKMVLSPQMDLFDISREPQAMRGAYGESDFAAGCLLARRLVEAGVTFVEVNAGNWDTHFDNFDRSKELCGQVDQPYAQLLRDLKQRGLLERTLVIWMGEFGRTPRINARGGRDHYPRAFNAALAGGGVRGGQVIGRTDAGGTEVDRRPIEVPDLFRTFYELLGIDADHENAAGERPVPLIEGGQAVREVWG